MEFIESPAFSRYYREYLSEDDYRKFQAALATNPEAGDLMPGTGGFRKVRWSDPRRGKGRRGGLRIIYYYFSSDGQIWLVAIYDKSEMFDLSAAEKKALRQAVAAETGARMTSRNRGRWGK